MGEQLQMFGGSWTEEKLDILREYLRAYTTALKNQPFAKVYIDAFAGTGYRRERERQFRLPYLFDDLAEPSAGQFLAGSAKIALEVEPPFDEYLFVESDEEKVRRLEALRDTHPGRAERVRIDQADANEFVQAYCRERDWRTTRAVLFLDPFATQVEWKTVEAVRRTEAVDVWILFPLMAVNRLLANDPDKACRERLDAIFGTDE